MKRKGFTLIELLVVVAIISLLAGILFPVFARARENARQASCLSNVKQLGLAIEQYKQDYDGFYPFARGPKADSWYGNFLEPYIKARQIIFCPSAPSQWPIDYAYNASFGYAITVPTQTTITCNGHPNGPLLNEAAVTEPSTSILVVDSSILYWRYRATNTIDDTNFDASYFNCVQPTTTTLSTTLQPDSGIHMDGVNVLYADAHAKWQKASSIWGVVNQPSWCAIK
jgi:prepilin-type N-terminal cleavage/methylation domain-containing protein/prepilin-type processing-associated H-X9-DG protein